MFATANSASNEENEPPCLSFCYLWSGRGHGCLDGPARYSTSHPWLDFQRKDSPYDQKAQELQGIAPLPLCNFCQGKIQLIANFWTLDLCWNWIPMQRQEASTDFGCNSTLEDTGPTFST